MLRGSRAARSRPHPPPPEPEAFYGGEPAGKRAQDLERGGSEGVRRRREPPLELEGDVASAPKTAAILRVEPVPRVGGPPPPPLAPQRLPTTGSFSTGVLLSPKSGFRGPGSKLLRKKNQVSSEESGVLSGALGPAHSCAVERALGSSQH
nr:formin-like protein 5 [Peromyscus maniculatus bairdii]